ncbi:hypothetical protein EJB05_15382, partial [Eragrostis curvula]
MAAPAPAATHEDMHHSPLLSLSEPDYSCLELMPRSRLIYTVFFRVNHGLLSDPVFRRRYCRYHRTPPLLGFVHNEELDPRFVSTVASPCSPPALDCHSWWALDCRHGRILIHRFAPTDLVVFDPLTGEQQHLPLHPYPHACFTGAVLCAVAGCDHLDCHSGPFLEVFVGTDDDGPTWASVYSSETGMCILRYDLARRGFSVIDVPDEYEEMGTFVMVEDRSLHLWSSQEAGPDGSAGWRRCRVIELTTLLPISDTTDSIDVVGFLEGTDTIFLSTNVGIFALKIKSGRVTKLGESGPYSAIIPCTGFYLPGV